MPGGRAIAGALLAFSTLACGKITSGEDLSPEDAGPSIPDTGEGPADTGPAPDLGCRTLDPPPPAAWPFEHSKQAYLDYFYNAVPNTASCSQLVACHQGDAVESSKPRIPNAVDIGMLDDPTFLDTAIGELWDATKPKTYTAPSPESGGPVVGFVWIHDRSGGNVLQQYSAAQLAAAKAFLRIAEPCKWKQAYDDQMAGNFHCTGGSPPPDAGPPADAQVSDAQASDGGDGGPQDAAAVDTGPRSGFCDCPVPANLNFSACR